MNITLGLGILLWVFGHFGFDAIAAKKPKKGPGCEAAGDLVPSGESGKRNPANVLPPPEIAAEPRALAQWRADQLTSAIDKTADHFIKTRQLFNAETCRSITGFNWDQLMGVHNFRIGATQERARFTNGPVDFCTQLEKKLLELKKSNPAIPDFNPYEHFHVIEKDPKAPAFLTAHRQMEKVRLVRRALGGIAAGKTLENADATAVYLEIEYSALFRAKEKYKPSGDRQHMGRFDGYLNFVDELERERVELIQSLETKIPRNQKEDAELDNLKKFSVWRLERILADTKTTRKVRESLLARDRPEIQKWVVKIVRDLPENGTPVASLKQIALAIQANRKTPPWGDIFPSSAVAIEQMLIGAGAYSSKSSSRRIFDSLEQFQKAYDAEDPRPH